LTIIPGPEPLKNISDEEKAKRRSHEDRREQAREERKKRRQIPRPNRRGRKLTRRPGLAPAASSRRPKSRMRGPRQLDRRGAAQQGEDPLGATHSGSESENRAPDAPEPRGSKEQG
jgi:hypothetical protein